MRPFTLLPPAVGTAAAAGVAVAASGAATPVLPLLLACVSAAAATGASNAWNQVFDVEVDRRNKPERPIVSGALSARRGLVAGDLLAVASLVAGAFASTVFLACVSAGLLSTWIYSAPPLRAKRRPLPALVTIAVPRGLLVPVAGWSVVATPAAPDPWALGAVAFFFVLGAAATKDFSDTEGDRAGGCVTLPLLLGSRRAAQVVAPFLVLPFLLYPVFGSLGWLRPSPDRLLLLGGLLAAGGALVAIALVRDPERLARGDRNHPAWRGMYLLLLGSQVGAFLVYAL